VTMSMDMAPNTRAAQLQALAHQMDVVARQYFSMDHTPEMKAFALGRMMSIKYAADLVKFGQEEVKLPKFWTAQCTLLNV
jgi:hypothetical protein